MNKLNACCSIFLLFSFLSIHAQWRYPNYHQIEDDVIITYTVDYDNILTEKQEQSSSFKKEIVVIFNKYQLIEKSIRNTFGPETFYQYNFETEKAYKGYRSTVKKKAIVRDFQVGKKKPIKIKGQTRKILGYTSDVYEILVGAKLKEVITTKEIGLRYIKFFNIEGFLLKYSSIDKKLGPYTVTASKITYAKLPENTYSLKGYTLRTVKEQKAYDLRKKKNRLKVAEKSVKKIGKKAPSYTLINLDGKKLKNTKLKGKIIVFSFFLTNGDASIKQIPILNKLQEKFKNKNVAFIAISLEKEYKLNTFLKRYPFHYNIIENGRWVAEKFDINLFPTNIIIDKKGKYQYYKTSYNVDLFDSMSYKIEKLLKR